MHTWRCAGQRGGEGSGIWAGREGRSEKQVVWLQATVGIEVPQAGHVGPSHNRHSQYVDKITRQTAECGVQKVNCIPLKAHPLF